MTSQDWRNWAGIFKEGARSILGWPDPGVAGLANALITMADQCSAAAEASEKQETT